MSGPEPFTGDIIKTCGGRILYVKYLSKRDIERELRYVGENPANYSSREEALRIINNKHTYIALFPGSFEGNLIRADRYRKPGNPDYIKLTTPSLPLNPLTHGKYLHRF